MLSLLPHSSPSPVPTTLPFLLLSLPLFVFRTPIQEAGEGDWIKIPYHFKVDPPEYNSFLDLGFGDIFDLDLDRVVPQHRFWDMPGADPSSFFNFGMNKQTWLEYCAKIQRFRRTFALNKQLRIMDSSNAQLQVGGAGSESRVGWGWMCCVP